MDIEKTFKLNDLKYKSLHFNKRNRGWA
jgi:hypothetical protein